MTATTEAAIVSPELPDDVLAFVARAKADAEHAFAVLRAIGSITANGTVSGVERIPGHELFVTLTYPGPFAVDQSVTPSVVGFDGTVRLGDARAARGFGFQRVLAAHDAITTVVHIHSPYLGAWSQSHRPLPIRYVPVQRDTLAREIPVYIDRRGSQVDFILDRLGEEVAPPAILEANGGATVWGTAGFLATIEYAVLLEEGAQLQLLAESLGGSREYGPGVLTEQWTRFNNGALLPQAKALGLLPEE
ncbi:class II aldolase/adducin family protein [Yinghuangia sp. ASG 101]|uniref:class II aldolase/adducin family protein n=1 Tax=Yinghuangia sp. ASG 101 TaxID=2896848 RepID=UPI001E5D13E1|nr:class II aldolase/adducin family protein [Yinghuangia sp. ASG 101]UGQ12096.1 class II aldolase/adducin family protein [Yinghuangia sp. ASG 101]